DLLIDGAHCGTCGNACPGGWTCCNGACSNPVDDVQNCGGCGAACTAENGFPGCSMRHCVIDHCQSGWGDCDGQYNDGCETDLAGNPNDCGACNHACTFLHASARCVLGQCAIDTCTYPYADCDASDTDGCELD